MLPKDKKSGGTADLIDRPTEDEVTAPNLDGDSRAPLLPASEAEGLRSRWEECQRRFVDEPRESVKSADELVAELMQTLARQFAESRESLEQQWGRGDDVSTEDLRIALQRYREFFNRLLAV
jgi:hypothetical protein